MWRALAAALILSGQPAMAARCPYGQIYRVRLMECVDWHSALARAYVTFPTQHQQTDGEDHSWYVEITKLPPDVAREIAIEKLKELLNGKE